MLDIHKRFLLFLIGCMGSRLAITWLAYYISVRNPKPRAMVIMGAIAIVISLAFFYIYLTGSRKTGAEVFGDRIWWNALRPVHGILFAVFGILAITGHHIDHAWKILLLDTCIGLVAFSLHHLGTHKKT
jgi:hypothetical protein